MPKVCGLRVIAKTPGSNAEVKSVVMGFTCFDGELNYNLGTITLPAGYEYYITFDYDYDSWLIPATTLFISTTVSAGGTNIKSDSIMPVFFGRGWTWEHKIFSYNTPGTYTVYFTLLTLTNSRQSAFFTLQLTESPKPLGKISAISPNPGTQLRLNTSSSYTFTIKVRNYGNADGRIITEATITQPDKGSVILTIGDEIIKAGEEKTYTLNYSFVNAGTYNIDFTVKTEIKGNLVVTDKCP